MITEYFGKQPCKSINPDEAVACGAAIVAYQLSAGPERPLTSSASSASTFSFKLREVTPLTLGIRGRGGIMNPVIHRNTELPCSHTIECKTAEDNQSIILFRVYEGERPLVRDNHFLGKFAIDNIPQGPSGSQRFELTFTLDSDGQLTASAKSKTTGLKNSITIDGLSCLNRSQVNKLLDDVAIHKQDDDKQYESVRAWVRLDDYVHQIRQRIDKRAQEGRLTPTEQRMLEQAVERELEWLQKNKTSFNKAEADKRYQAWLKLADKTLKL
jgi:molecular chaperone DnaK (HSP70)